MFSPATGLQFTPLVNANATAGVIAENETIRDLFEGKATQITLAGQPAWHGPMYGGAESAWIRSSLMITVNGSDLSTTDSVLAVMIAAQLAR